MRSKFKWIITLLLAFSMQSSFAQEKTVTGNVTDTSGSLPGVNVVVQGTTRSAQTDLDGNFSIRVSAGEKLVFTFLGFKSQTLTVGTSNSIAVRLVDDATALDAVVVEGYNITKTKAKSNVASVTVSSKTIEARPNASFIQTLQSQVAGLNISTGSGQPGAGSQVIIRGAGSVNGKVEPLYVIDGIALNADNFRSLNPDDIESISVLKDAGATSIYGNRGANGVILVKTKKGSFEAPLAIRVTSTTGFTTLQKTKYNLMNSQQLLTLERLKGSGRGATGGIGGIPLTDAEINAAPNTNWTDYFFRTGVTQNQVVSFTAGGKNVSSFTSLGYFDQQGILENTDLKRFSFRSNISGKSNNDKFSYTTGVSINFSRRNEATSLGTGGINQNFVIGANSGAPYLSPNDYVNSAQLNTAYRAGGTLLLTPLMLVDKLKTYKNTLDEIKGLVNLDANYKITNDLVLGTSLGIDFTQGTSFAWQSPTAFNSLLFQNGTEAIGTETQRFERDLSINSNTRLSYNKTVEKHSFGASLFTEYIKAHFDSFLFQQRGLNPKTTSPGGGTGYVLDNPNNDFNVPLVSAASLSTGLFSYFATADYDYDSRFGFGATVRRDASSRFAQSNRWGTFYSLSGRWNIDKEAFMQGSIFDALKLRGSYGTSGNQDISNGTYLSLNSTRELYRSGVGYGGTQSYVISQLANPNLKWETISQGNIGIDFEMFKNRFQGSIDIYKKKTTDLFLPVNISAINAQTVLNSNFGSMQNEGLEANFAYDLLKSNTGLNLTLRYNGAWNKNRILAISNASGFIDNGLSIVGEGGLLNQFFLVRYIGVNPANGNLLFLDKAGNPTETPDAGADRVATGKSAVPVIQGGFGLDANYKGFFLSAQFSYVTDIYRFDYDLDGLQDPTSIGIFNQSTDMLRAWTPDNRITDIPSLSFTNAAQGNASDRFLKDASYVRLRFASFGYDFPKKLLDKTFLSSVKAFVQAENLITWSKWRGWDAESSRAEDQYQYPTPKIVSIGLQLEF